MTGSGIHRVAFPLEAKHISGKQDNQLLDFPRHIRTQLVGAASPESSHPNTTPVFNISLKEMRSLLLLCLIDVARGNGFFDNVFRSHLTSTTTGYDLNYPELKYETHPSPKPQVGTFFGMPPPPDSPYMGSMTTRSPLIVPWKGPSSLPMRDDQRRPQTTEVYKREELPSIHPMRESSTGGSDQRDSRDTSGKSPFSKSSKEEDDWTSLSLQGKEGEAKTKPSEKWCKNYNSKCRSSTSDPNGISVRITGGQPAKPKEHPHMVMIGYGERNKKQWLCGGTLVSDRFILSAAHCANTANVSPAKWVRLGDLDISSSREDARPQERSIVERIVHPEYIESSVYHDIALFKMDTPVVFNDWISPVCLHTGSSELTTRAKITGWGRTNFVSETSPVLMEADVTIFNSTYCKETIDRIAGPKMPKGYDSNTMICAGEDNGGKDACQGDSGGPLVIEGNGCSKLQVGITSVGRECGLPHSPGVYTRVSSYIPWLESVIWR